MANNLIKKSRKPGIKAAVAFSMVVLSSVMFTSCEKVVGEGPVVTQTRALEDFKGVSVNISGNVTYKIAPQYKVELRAQQNILDIIQTNKVGDDLVIKFKDGKNVKSNADITILVEGPVLEWANLSGSGELKVTGKVTEAQVGIRVSGSGNIDVADILVSDKITANVSGSGNIMVRAGASKNIQAKVSGSGNIHLEDVVAESALTEISGSGNIQVNLTKNLDATISGSGSVYYLGTPLVTTHISGSGKVRPL